MNKKSWQDIAKQERDSMNKTRQRYDTNLKIFASICDQISNSTPEERLHLITDLFYYGFAQGRKAGQAENKLRS